jgi:hypothetical protein
MNEALLDKIAALLVLAEKNNNVHEAATAAAMAQSLLTKHRLTLEDIEATREEKIDEQEPLWFAERLIFWKGVLAEGVSSANGCKVFWNKSYGKMTTIGRLSEVQIVRYFYCYLEREIERLCKLAQVENIDSDEPPLRGKTETNSFKMGAASEVVRRLKASNEEQMRAADNQSRAIVLQKDAELKVFLEKYSLSRHSGGRIGDRDAYVRGKEAGGSIALNKGLDGRPIKMLR